MVLSHLNPKLRNLLWLCGGYVSVGCECIFFFSPPLTYSSSFSSPPPTRYQPTLSWPSYEQRDLSHSILRMLSLAKHIPKYSKLVLPLHLLDCFFFRPLCFEPSKALFYSHREKNAGRKKRAIEIKTSSVPSSASFSFSSLLSPSTSHILFNSKNAERLGQRM